MKNKKESNTPNLIIVVGTIISLIFMVSGIFYATIGYHNFDLGHNIKYINAQYDLELVDFYTDDLSFMTSQELINTGSIQMLVGTSMSIYYAMVLGMIIMLNYLNSVGKAK